jgi:hypothetical protein
VCIDEALHPESYERSLSLKLALFIGCEILIFALLGCLLLVTLLWQPMWVWLLAPSAMFAGFVAIMFLVRSNRSLAQALVLLCPVTYTVWWFGLGIALQSGPSDGFIIAVFGYYAAGALLLWLHLLLNARMHRA